MAAIRKRIGVCPQFDVQWGQLTAWEHLELFGTLKGLARNPAALRHEIVQRLKQVGLTKKEPWLPSDIEAAAEWPVGLKVVSGGGKAAAGKARSLRHRE